MLYYFMPQGVGRLEPKGRKHTYGVNAFCNGGVANGSRFCNGTEFHLLCCRKAIKNPSRLNQPLPNKIELWITIRSFFYVRKSRSTK